MAWRNAIITLIDPNTAINKYIVAGYNVTFHWKYRNCKNCQV